MPGGRRRRRVPWFSFIPPRQQLHDNIDSNFGNNDSNFGNNDSNLGNN